ncbi:MAG: hypothetical protein KM310_00010 [Clostridiales bacterium]|nr:hypothetical protein [Clostridiales bacterium]
MKTRTFKAIAFALTLAVVLTAAPFSVFGAAPLPRHDQSEDRPWDTGQHDVPPPVVNPGSWRVSQEPSHNLYAEQLVDLLYNPEVQEWAVAEHLFLDVMSGSELPPNTPESLKLKIASLKAENANAQRLLYGPFSEDEARQAYAREGMYDFSDEAIEHFNTQGYPARAAYERLKAVAGDEAASYLVATYLVRQEEQVLNELRGKAATSSVRPESDFVFALGELVYQKKQEQKSLTQALDKILLDRTSRPYDVPTSRFLWFIARGVATVARFVGFDTNTEAVYKKLGGSFAVKREILYSATDVANAGFYTGTLVAFNQHVANDPDLVLVTALLTEGPLGVGALSNPAKASAVLASVAGMPSDALIAFLSKPAHEREALVQRYKTTFMQYAIERHNELADACRAYMRLASCFDEVLGWRTLSNSIGVYFDIAKKTKSLDPALAAIVLRLGQSTQAAAFETVVYQNLGPVPPRKGGGRAWLQPNNPIQSGDLELTNKPRWKTYLSE